MELREEGREDEEVGFSLMNDLRVDKEKSELLFDGVCRWPLGSGRPMAGIRGDGLVRFRLGERKLLVLEMLLMLSRDWWCGR